MGRFLQSYKKILGIFGLLVVICVFTASQSPDAFLQSGNLQNTMRWTALFGIIAIGVSFVIMTGGIDLSIGSVIGLLGCVLAMLLSTTYTAENTIEVTNVSTDSKQLTCAKPPPYAVGQKIVFLDRLFTVASIDGDILTTEEPIKTAAKRGSSLSAREIVEIRKPSDQLVRVGATTRQPREIVLKGSGTGFKEGDRLELIYEVGAGKTFPIQGVVAGENNTVVVTVLTNAPVNGRVQKLRNPSAAKLSTRSQFTSIPVAIGTVLGLALLIGLAHGLLITKLGLQPFIVTLCGLLFYRGLARFLTEDKEQGFAAEYLDLKQFAKGDFFEIIGTSSIDYAPPMPFIYFVVIGIIAAVFLNRTIYGRYILALGSNEEAARYSGINTDRMIILSYMICAFCAGLAAILFALDLNSLQPAAHGEFYELYAIAAAVLGGCSLRGGEGSILGVMIAAAVMRVLNNAINLIDGIDTRTEFAIIGMVILAGVIADELFKRGWHTAIFKKLLRR